MTPTRTIVVGLGNDLIADDGVGVLAARALKAGLAGRADVVETAMHGLALLDIFLGYDRAILLDAIQTGKQPPGAVIEINAAELDPVIAPSPHFAGLPEMVALARQLQLDFPKEFRIFAVEVADARTIGGPMTPAVRDAIPQLCARVCEALATWV
ncbi:MAG: hydrogenase maturation protease [Verrucomicrobia bacterium]|nr:hydrogenase maturation protease [Verrucomicrobiota bacterium]